MSPEGQKNLTCQEVAEIFRVTAETIRLWCVEGTTFPNAFKMGRKWLIPEGDVKACLAAQYGAP